MPARTGSNIDKCIEGMHHRIHNKGYYLKGVQPHMSDKVPNPHSSRDCRHNQFQQDIVR